MIEQTTLFETRCFTLAVERVGGNGLAEARNRLAFGLHELSFGHDYVSFGRD